MCVHHGNVFVAEVQLKIISVEPLLSERGNASEGFVVMPPITFSVRRNQCFCQFQFKHREHLSCYMQEAFVALFTLVMVIVNSECQGAR